MIRVLPQIIKMSRILLPRLHFVFITDSKVLTLDLSGRIILGAKGAKGFFILRPSGYTVFTTELPSKYIGFYWKANRLCG